MPSRVLRPAEAEDFEACEAILRSLPDWFGIEESILEYCRDMKAMETFVAVSDGDIAGFLTLKSHNPRAAEIHVMAVRASQHRRGIGRELVRHAELHAREQGVAFLQVKTLGPSRPNAEYAGTRAFYQSMGFTPLEENHLWGDRNPCLIQVKHLVCE